MKLKRLLFLTLLFGTAIVSYGQLTSIDVTSEYDFMTAIKFANQQHVDTIYLSSSGGVYTTSDTLYYNITTPLVIMAKPGLAEMPVITHSDDSSSIIELFRYSNDFTLDGVILDGMHELSHSGGLKHAIRAGNGPDDIPLFKKGSDLIVKNCIIRNFYEGRDTENGEGHGIYFLINVEAGIVKVENTTFENIGDEAIRMTETEKYSTERCLDSLIVRNCTFTNILAECIRFYADTDTSTTDAGVILENLTINNCAMRAMYVKNNANTVVRNIIATNSIFPRPGRADRMDYLIQIQNVGSYISNIDTLNLIFAAGTTPNKISAVKGGIGVIEGTVFGFDPLYSDPDNRDYTLPGNSAAYYSGYNNTHLGDARWATATPTVSPLNVTIAGKGQVEFSPERVGLVFPGGTEVTVTAVADSGYEFSEWGGDLSGNTNPSQITVEGIKNITATFSQVTTDAEEISTPLEYSLEQNYPNPFNPSTAIRFSLKESGVTSVRIYNAIGQEVMELFNKEMKAGTYNYYFDASSLSSGVYFYQLTSGNYKAARKMMLIK
ncbi:MAG: T9SS type A sorting domain-containing protein [Melioribacteraceae bacterium]|nr:T9SS type A sorting domain-containing protein [Melioribacteraceae bacterium]